jgi:hypothetical protein
MFKIQILPREVCMNQGSFESLSNDVMGHLYMFYFYYNTEINYFFRPKYLGMGLLSKNEK